MSTTISGNPGCCAIFQFPLVSTGTRSISNCTFDLIVVFGTIHNLSVTNTVFAHSNVGSGIIAPDDSYFNNNLSYGSDFVTASSIRDCYFLARTASNPHYTDTTNGTTATFTGCIWDQPNTTATAGDCVLVGGVTLTFLKCFQLMNADLASGPGVLVRYLGSSTGNFTAEHCLVIGDQIMAFEEGTSAAGFCPSLRSNILFWPSSSGIPSTQDLFDNQTGITDTLTVGGYNGMLNPRASGDTSLCAGVSKTTHGYVNADVSASGFPNASLGTGDFQADPQFVDTDYRNFVKWCNKIQGTANTLAAAMTYIQANPSQIPTMIQWVRAGYVPTNIAYQATSYPGDTSTTDANGTAWPGGAPGVGPMAYKAASTTGGAAALAAM